MVAPAKTPTTPEQLADRMKSDILALVQAGTIPATAASFAELHDYCDANCLGGTEKMLEDMDATGPQTEEAHSANLDAFNDLCNPAMDIVDAWIKAGGLK